MSVAFHRLLLSVLAAVVMVVTPAGAGAAEDDGDATPSGPLRKEWVGLELMPISYATARPPSDELFSALRTGPGGSIRVGRYRGHYAYVIPFMVSLYVSGGGRAVLAHSQFEAGLIVPGTARRLELGGGLGLGVLSLQYATGCDGSCVIGGTGPMASLAARVLVWSTPTFTAGINARAIIPFVEPMGEFIGYYTGRSSVVMAALEVGYGRP